MPLSHFYHRKVMELSKKIVILTGATTAIGDAAARHLAEHGAQLVVVGGDIQKLDALAAECHKHRINTPLVITGDVSEPTDVTHIVKQTLNHYGKVDVLVNIAEEPVFDDFGNSNVNLFDSNVRRNLRSVYLMTAMLSKHLAKTNGNIVNVIHRTKVAGVCEVLAKTGVEAMTKLSAEELKNGVRVNCVEAFILKEDAKEENEDTCLKLLDAARAITFFACNDFSNCINGACISVNCRS